LININQNGLYSAALESWILVAPLREIGFFFGQQLPQRGDFRF